jgi:voltage-gated potassium channel
MAEERLNRFDLLVLGLSIWVLLALPAPLLFDLSDEGTQLLLWADTAVCIVFLADFFARLWKAPDRLRFLRWGWIDFIASIPMLEALRWGRLFRIARIIRLLRAFKSVKTFLSFAFQRKADAAFALACSVAFLALTFGAVSVLEIEAGHPDANIRTGGDAIWWAFVTVTTVGYGDLYPVTGEGRVIAVGLMIIGIGLFGTFTGALASLILSPGSGSASSSQLDDIARTVIAEIEQRQWTTRSKREPDLADQGGRGPE